MIREQRMKKRYAAEKRFQFLGVVSICISIFFVCLYEFERCLPKLRFLLRFLLPWPGHPWTPWVELHFRYSDWPQVPYVNMTLFPLGIAPNASNRPRTLFRLPDGPALEPYGFFTVWLHSQISKSYGSCMVLSFF